jgi:hypothetical protein
VPRSGPPKFDLDFPGGTPADLIGAIQKVTEQPLNVIVPPELADTKLPPFKVRSAAVWQVFEALGAASRKTERVPVYRQNADGSVDTNYSVFNTSYGFEAGRSGGGDETPVWYFRAEVAPPAPLRPPERTRPKTCVFYQLGPYLETYKVEDITTSIETGWRMLGETNLPELKFHKDTKLLIAVGESNKLALIDQVLKQLDPTVQPISKTKTN